METLVDRISQRRVSDKGTVKVAVTMGLALAFGILGVFITLANQGTVWRGLLWAAAWSAVGWFLGFLFGIPRYLSTDTVRKPADPRQQAANEAAANAVLQRKAVQDAATARDAAQRLADERARAADRAEQEARTALQRSIAAAADPDLQSQATALTSAAATARTASDAAQREAQAAADALAKAELNAATADAGAREAADKLAAAGAAGGAIGSSLTVNTNFEQISDWLTKIIVGVSLVEAQSMVAKLQEIATYMAHSMAGAEQLVAYTLKSPTAAEALALAQFRAMESFSYALMIYFLAAALLGSYLLTRLFLQPALDDAATPR